MIEGIVHYWPKAHSQCELILLDEIEKIIGSVDGAYVSPALHSLLPLFKKCILSEHYCVWIGREFQIDC